MQNNKNIKEILQEFKLDSPLDIDEIRISLFGENEIIKGQEIQEAESIYYYDLQNFKDKGEKCNE